MFAILWINKHCTTTKISPSKILFHHILAQNFKILVPTPHNTPLVMGGRDFKFSKLSRGDNTKIEFQLVRFSLNTLYYGSQSVCLHFCSLFFKSCFMHHFYYFFIVQI